MVFYTFIWKYFKISILWKHPPFENIHFFKISIFRPLDRPLETWPDVEFRIPSDQLIFGLVFGSGTDCNLWLWDRICYQYFFWLNNDSPDAFLGPPPPAAEKKKSHQSDNTNIRSYFIKYIPIKLSKKVSKPKPPKRISDSTIHTKCKMLPSVGVSIVETSTVDSSSWDPE